MWSRSRCIRCPRTTDSRSETLQSVGGLKVFSCAEDNDSVCGLRVLLLNLGVDLFSFLARKQENSENDALFTTFGNALMENRQAR